MPHVPMQKINIIFPREYLEEILHFLQKKELVQVVDLEKNIKKTLAKIPEEERHDFDYLLAEVQFAINFLEGYQVKEKIGFLKRLFAPAYTLTSEEFDRIIKTFYFKDVIEECKNLEEKINQLLVHQAKLTEEQELLSPWKRLDIPLYHLKKQDKIKIICGNIPLKNYPAFVEELVKVKLVCFEKISLIQNNVNLFIIFDKRQEELIKKILDKYEFGEIILPERESTPLEELKKIKHLLNKTRKKLKIEEKKARQLSFNLPKLKVIYDYLLWGKAHQEVQTKIGGTAHVFVLSCWLKKRDFKYLKEELEKITQGKIEVKPVKPSKTEMIPVCIENRPILRPFEPVTTIYGLPLPFEPDPTPYLAPFFILFFGLCLSDAGYGIAICGLIWLVLTLFKIPKENQRLFRLLIYGGITTFIAGALFGGWFGINLTNLPPAISMFLMRLRILDPMREPVPFLILALVLGVSQILTGIAIKMFWLIRQKKFKEAFLGPLPWLYFFVAIIFWAMSKFGLIPQTLNQPGYYLFISGILGLILTQGYKQKNIFMKLGSGVMSLYGLVGYLSDILSYARLLALGLCTSVIGMVVNLVSIMFRDMIPVIGWLVMILILIGGHLFNLAISGLGAFIHSARLQYVEFFPKFMEGGGEKFQPFKREFKYVNIKS